MIPASYLYKDALTQAWGDPSNSQPEPVRPEPRGPHGGHLAGLLARLLGVRLHQGRHTLRHA